jgi:hypothetical protein
MKGCKTMEAKNPNDAAAKRLIEEYYARFDKMDNRSHTLIFRARKDIDLARCYLERKTVEETVQWMKKERDFKTSMSAVGRYFTRFAQLPPAIKIV